MMECIGHAKAQTWQVQQSHTKTEHCLLNKGPLRLERQAGMQGPRDDAADKANRLLRPKCYAADAGDTEGS